MLLFGLLELLQASEELFVSMGVTGLVVTGILNFFLPLVFPFPPLIVMIPLVAASPELALVFVVAATAGELFAGIIGYGIGRKGGRPALKSRFSNSRTDRVESYFERNGFATVTIGSFAPIPEAYELLSVGSGVFGMKFRTFLIASIIGRGAKYLLVAALVIAIGDAAEALGEGQIYAAIGAVTIVAVAVYLTRKYWVPETWGRRPLG
ncbi:YqaA family protein [Natrialbaceae archaeon A-arb3/5]